MGAAVEREACGEIVGGVYEYISGGGRAVCEALGFHFDTDGRIERGDAAGKLDGLFRAGIGLCKLYLPLQV